MPTTPIRFGSRSSMMSRAASCAGPLPCSGKRKRATVECGPPAVST